ncbi:MAG: PAS domain S-box protein [Sphingomicrobium sp.]
MAPLISAGLPIASPIVGRAARVVLVAVLMFCLALAGIELTRISGRIASVWLANGAVLAVMMRSAHDEWPSLVGAAFLANIGANLSAGDAGSIALTLSLCNSLEIGCMAVLLGRGNNQRAFEDPQTMFRFALAAACAPIGSGLIASAFLVPALDIHTALLFGQWYLADILGLLMVTPLVLTWSGRWTWPASLQAALEPLLFLIATAAASTIIFSNHQPRLFLLCPILLFAGFRLPTAWSSLVAALSAGLAIAFTFAGHGPIAPASVSPAGQILLLQAYFAVGLILTIPVSAITAERNRLELALTGSERQFRLMAEASPAGILQCRLDGSPLYINSRWTDLTGVGLEELTLQGWECVVPETQRGQARALFQQARGDIAEGSECLRCDLLGRPNGWAEFYVTPEKDPAGMVVGWVVRLMDVTDRVEASSALAESEALYRLLAENTRDMIMRLALDGTKLFVSSASELLLGTKPERMIGKPIRAFIHPDDWDAVELCLKLLVSDDSRQSVRYRKRCSDGRYLWVEAVYHLVRDPLTSIPVEIVASVRDIDLRQRAELVAAEAAQKLRESNRLLTMAEELAVVGHWHFDPATNELEMSSQAIEMTGLERQGASSPATALAVVVPAERWRLKRAIVAAISRRSTGSCRIRIDRPDGEERYLDVAVQSERAGANAFAGLFGVVQDVTTKVADESKLVAALEKARAAADAKSAFLATMSHEIRTPMTGVLGMIDLLRDSPSDQDRDNFLTTLKQSAALLMAVLNDVLDFSKMEHNRLEIHACDFDFEALAQATLDLFFNAASQKGLLITLALDPGSSPFVHGDPVRIQQVMSNLINNAIKFTDSGSVAVRVKARAGRDRTQLWRVEVRDTGIGVPDGQIDNLFDPFTQADEGTGRRFGGTGLGLAISRRLIEAMGGTIGLTSKPGSGSTFWFELELDEATAEPVRARPMRVAIKPARALQVLVAEDNPVNQLLVSALLRRQGHVPTCVDDGLKAVDAAIAGHFDCILMDMQMPVMDGITATRTIRQSTGPCANVPIIALTADASPERRRFYDNAGLTDFMTKPIDGEALANRLAEIAAPSSSAAHSGAIDEAHLDRLRAALGPTRLQSLLDLFLVELESRPGRLCDHLLTGRLDQAKAEAHSLKGAALSIGANDLGNAALAIEQLAAASNTKLVTKLIDALEKAVAEVRIAFGAPLPDDDRASSASV